MVLPTKNRDTGDDDIGKKRGVPSRRMLQAVGSCRMRASNSILLMLKKSKRSKRIEAGTAEQEADISRVMNGYCLGRTITYEPQETLDYKDTMPNKLSNPEDRDCSVTSDECSNAYDFSSSGSASFDEGSYDVTLISSDFKTLPAVRNLLAAKSPVFRRILNGTGEDSSILINCPSRTLCHIVEYCCTEKIDMSSNIIDEHTIRTLVHLFAAGQKFAIPGIKEIAMSKAYEALANFKPLACAILDETVVQRDPAVMSEFLSVVFQTIRTNPRAALLPQTNVCGGGTLSLGSLSLSMIIKDEQIDDEETKLSCLDLWANAKSDQVYTSIDLDKASRYRVAKDLSSHLRLERISPSYLQSIFEFSNILSEQQLLKACNEQGSLAERGFDVRSLLGKKKVNNPNGGFVVVRNAGIPVLNGIYTFSYENNKLAYSMDGTWKGENVTFKLFRKTPHWYIGLPDHSSSTMFYCAPVEANNCLVPPREQWRLGTTERAVCQGVSPLPVSFWIPDT